MSTNMYVQLPPCENACEHCDQATVEHLGMFASGWPFMFRSYPIPGTDRYTRYEEWLQLASSGQIRDEYGSPWTLERLLQAIDKVRDRHRGPQRYSQTDDAIIDLAGRRWYEHEFS